MVDHVPKPEDEDDASSSSHGDAASPKGDAASAAAAKKKTSNKDFFDSSNHLISDGPPSVPSRPAAAQAPRRVTQDDGNTNPVFFISRYLGGKYHFWGFFGLWYAVVLVCVVFLVSWFSRRPRGSHTTKR